MTPLKSGLELRQGLGCAMVGKYLVDLDGGEGVNYVNTLVINLRL